MDLFIRMQDNNNYLSYYLFTWKLKNVEANSNNNSSKTRAIPVIQGEGP
jgi:hypothetical protein